MTGLNSLAALASFAAIGIVLLPMLGAAVSALLPPTGRRIVTIAVAVTICLLTVPLVTATATGSVTEVFLGGYTAPLGIGVRVDGLSALFVPLTTVVGTSVAVVGAASHKAAGGPGFHPLWLGAWSGLNAVFVAGDLFNTYVGLEVVSLTAIGLVALGGRASWSAALRYLFIAVPGALLYLVGVGLIVAQTGTLDIAQSQQVLASQTSDDLATVLALCLMTVGLSMKLALFPMHRWLIPAHSGAPTAVSPVLSGLVIKASLFVIFRMWIWLVVPAVDSGGLLAAVAWLLAGLGTAALICGSIMALRQTHLKPLIAYSTAAQVGYWFLFFPILVDPTPLVSGTRPAGPLTDEWVLSAAVTGSVGLAVGHGLSKAGLFLAAGYFKDHYGTDEIVHLRGVASRHPMTFLTMALCAIGLVGLPFSLAFSGKWTLATAAVATGHYWLLVVVVVGTLLSAGYMMVALAPFLREPESDEQSSARRDDSETANIADALENVETPATVSSGSASTDSVQLEALEPTTDEASERTSGWADRVPQIVVFTLGTLTVLSGLLGAWTGQLLEVGAPW